MIFTFISQVDGCAVTACSESQVTSIGDYGTNYCNLHDLYCNDDECHYFQHLEYVEKVGLCTDATVSKCYIV
jgi:hypothetical protein